MRQTLLLALLIVCNAATAQDYPFLSASSKRSNMSGYFDYLDAFPEKKKDSVFQKLKRYTAEGKLHTKAYADSIFKVPDNKYTTRVYHDTLVNDFTFVLYERTKEEMAAESEHWKNNMQNDEKNRKKLKGSVLDELTLTDMDGNTHTLESLKGKIIVLDFWFVNCGSCIQEMPELNKMREEFGTKDVAWFGITFDKKEKVVKFSEKIKFDFTLIPDGKYLVDRFGILYFPTTLIISPEREIVYTGKLSAMNGRADEIKKTLKKAVKDSKKSKKGK